MEEVLTEDLAWADEVVLEENMRLSECPVQEEPAWPLELAGVKVYRVYTVVNVIVISIAMVIG